MADTKQENTQQKINEVFDKKGQKSSLEEQASWFSKIFFAWTSPVIKFGNKNVYNWNNIYDVNKIEKFEHNFEYFKKNKEKAKPLPIVKLLLSAMNIYFFIGIFCLLCGVLLQLAGPIFMKEIIIYLEDEEDNNYTARDAYLFAGGIALAYFLRAILTSHGFHNLNRSGFKTLTILQSTLFDKIFNLSQGSIGQMDQGKIINLSNNDTFKLFQFFQFASLLFTSPIMVVISIFLIILEIGWAGAIGISVILIGTFLNGYVSTKLNKARKETQIFQDERAKILSEFLRGIKLVKYYGWEKFVIKKVFGVRAKEAKKIFAIQWIRMFMDLLMTVVPVLISVITFQIYVAAGNQLTTSKALVTMGYINLLIVPLRMLGFTVTYTVILWISIQRIQYFCEWEELKQIEQNAPDLAKGSILLEHAHFCWFTEQSKYQKEKFQFLYQKVKKAQARALQQQLDTIKNSDFYEINQKNTFFTDINLKVETGDFISIIGKVGSGKSSLLQAMLGEMAVLKGVAKYNGRVAYVTQTAWLLNETLKNNILFGEEYNEAKYKRVLKICELEEDIKILIDGDKTEIGERGINLSGGQKQRVCLARALYQNCDIYFFDDVLAALDSQVGKNIFENVIQKELSNKTRIMVTHQITYANQADKIIVMKDQAICEFDTYANLAANQESHYNILALQNSENNSNDEQENSDSNVEIIQKKESTSDMDKKNILSDDNLMEKSKEEDFDEELISEANLQLEIVEPKQNQLKQRKPSHKKSEQLSNRKKTVDMVASATKDKVMKESKVIGQIEEKQSGSVKWHVYKSYFAFGGLCLAIMLFIFQFFLVLFSTLPELWVSAWADDKFEKENKVYVLGYYLLALLIALFVVAKGLTFANISKNVAVKTSSQMLEAILRSTMKWFDNIQSGKILNRTNKDQEDVDMQLPWSFQFFINNLFNIFGYFILIGILQPIFIVLIVILVPIYVWLGKMYLTAARELKRIESLSRGPALSLFSEAFHGAMIIRTYKKQQYFFSNLAKRLNLYIQSSSNNYLTSRWISVITDMTIAILVSAVVFLGVFSKDFNYIDDGSLIGVTILAILKITGMISYSIKMYADVELQISAVERLLEYINKKDLEPDWDLPKIEEEWPSQGQIEFKNVTLRYDEELPIIINDISLTVKPGQKIGIIGRTGSGKSTITLGLLRILELAEQQKTSQKPEIKKGQLIIDGVDISQMGLHQLRQNVTIIPQDPFVFSGTLRSNVDPFNQFTNEEIIYALKRAYVFDQIKTPTQEEIQAVEKEQNIKIQTLSDNEKKLYIPLSEGGSTFSLGQRQLICMARAIIKKSKILIMDEATSSIDLLTDSNIQAMIQTEFDNTTILTIAHRLNTIITYDQILVLDSGRISEYDTPLNLLNNEKSEFTKLIRVNGEEFYKQMYDLASEKAKTKGLLQ